MGRTRCSAPAWCLPSEEGYAIPVALTAGRDRNSASLMHSFRHSRALSEVEGAAQGNDFGGRGEGDEVWCAVKDIFPIDHASAHQTPSGQPTTSIADKAPEQPMGGPRSSLAPRKMVQ